MNLSEHLDKGIWTIADKALLLLYGFAVIVFVANVLPGREWGAFALFQSGFLILCILADSIFLQPMVKFASEHEAEVDQMLAATTVLYSIFMFVFGFAFAAMNDSFAHIFKSPEQAIMLPLMPLLVALSLIRNIGI